MEDEDDNDAEVVEEEEKSDDDSSALKESQFTSYFAQLMENFITTWTCWPSSKQKSWLWKSP